MFTRFRREGREHRLHGLGASGKRRGGRGASPHDEEDDRSESSGDGVLVVRIEGGEATHLEARADETAQILARILCQAFRRLARGLPPVESSAVLSDEIIERMPKTEVHLHLEGTTSPETLWAMAERNGVSLPAATLAELRALYVFDSFDKFIELWLAMCSCLRSHEDYEQMVDGFVAECRRQNVRYVEAHFTPYNHERYGFGGERALDVVTRCLQAAEVGGGPVTRLILDIPSEAGNEAGPYTAALLEHLANPIVVAIGLGGPERGFPRSMFAPYFERARRAGYPTVAHAGETGGADHVRQAVEELKVRRVQHGVHAVDDPATLELLAERDVCCDVALSSNACLTDFRDLRAHPLRRMFAAGVPATLSTDDPPFFSTDLNREYKLARDEMELSDAQLWELNTNGLRYGLAETGLRRRLQQEFQAEGRKLGIVVG